MQRRGRVALDGGGELQEEGLCCVMPMRGEGWWVEIWSERERTREGKQADSEIGPRKLDLEHRLIGTSF
jgi:hypothetical protein